MKNIITTLLFLFGLVLVQAQDIGDLTVDVRDIEDGSFGPVVILLFNQKDGFPKEEDKAIYKAQVDRYVLRAKYTFQDIPYGRYAILAYVDRNRNGEMDTNMIGLPKEQVGVANMSRLAKPNFRKAIIHFSKDGQRVELGIVN